MTDHERRARRLLIASNVAMDELERIMDEVESPYDHARGLLFEARNTVHDSRRRYKLIKAAEKYVRMESTVAFGFNEAIDYLDKYPSKDKELDQIISKYRTDVSKHRFKSASKRVERLKGLIGFGHRPLHITISQITASADGNGFVVTVNNNLDQDIIIERVTVTSKSCSVESNHQGSITLAGRDQRTLRFEVDDATGDFSAVVSVDYILGFEHHTQSRTLTYRRS